MGLLLRPKFDATAVLNTVSRWADGHGIATVTAGRPVDRLPPGIEVAPLDMLARSELLLAVGGDGTVLRAMHLGAARGTPVLPVHGGRLGYFADIDASELECALDAFTEGHYTVEERPALTVGGGWAESTLVLNDVALRRVSGGRPAVIALHIDGELFMRYSGDGVIVATAAGSTAYSFSAGGPIVSPTLAATLVTPLAAHAPDSRPLVLSASEPVEVDVLCSSVRLAVEIDGRDHGTVGPGSQLRIGPSAVPGRLIRLGRIGFAARARQKLQISDSPELTGMSSIVPHPERCGARKGDP